MQHDRSTENNTYFNYIRKLINDKYQHSQQSSGNLVAAEGKSQSRKALPRGGPHRPEPKPFGQANLVALGPEIAQTRLPWLSVTVLICYTFWILLLGRLGKLSRILLSY